MKFAKILFLLIAGPVFAFSQVQQYQVLKLSDSLNARISKPVSPSTGQLLRYNGADWTSFTPPYLTSYTETDPVYTSTVSNQLMYKANIPASADLNTYTTTGIYVQLFNAQAATGTNYPIGLAGELEVIVGNAGMLWQTYRVYNDATVANRGTWKRAFYSSWGTWVKDIDNTALTTTLGAYELLSNKAATVTTPNQLSTSIYPSMAAFTGMFRKPVDMYFTGASGYDMSPVNNDWAWHDWAAFNRVGATWTFETSVDNGTNWTSGTFNKAVLAQKASVNVNTLTFGSTNAMRYTINTAQLNYSEIWWIMMVGNYGTLGVCVNVETSTDNITWTPRTTNTAYIAMTTFPLYTYMNYGLALDSWLRITITSNPAGTGSFNLNSLRLMARRIGSQGQYKEYEFPYTWDENRYMSIASPTTTTPTGFDLALLQTSSGQITRGSISNILDGRYIQNQNASAQTANSWINGSSRAGSFVDNALGYTIASQTGYTGFFTSSTLATAQNVKAGSLVISNSYATNAPTNGLYALGDAYLHGNVRIDGGQTAATNTTTKLTVLGASSSGINNMTLGSAANTTFGILGNGGGGTNGLYGLYFGHNSASGAQWIQAGRTDGTTTAYDILLQGAGGNVGIGITAAPATKLDVGGTIRQSGATSAMLKANGSGDIVAATLNTDYVNANIATSNLTTPTSTTRTLTVGIGGTFTITGNGSSISMGGSGGSPTLSLVGGSGAMSIRSNNATYATTLSGSNLTANRTNYMPNGSGVYALSVNGVTADNAGNISLGSVSINDGSGSYAVQPNDRTMMFYQTDEYVDLPDPADNAGRELKFRQQAGYTIYFNSYAIYDIGGNVSYSNYPYASCPYACTKDGYSITLQSTRDFSGNWQWFITDVDETP